jgi:hypothetical protein
VAEMTGRAGCVIILGAFSAQVAILDFKARGETTSKEDGSTLEKTWKSSQGVK